MMGLELYFVFASWFAGDPPPVVVYYGPMSQLECNALAEQTQNYSLELQAQYPDTELYLLNACVTEEELGGSAI